MIDQLKEPDSSALLASRRCPDNERFPGDIVGCGSTDVSDPDDEGICDCYNCGIWFPAAEANGPAQPTASTEP